MNYPTPGEILAKEPIEFAFFTERLQTWRDKHFAHWKSRDSEDQIMALVALVHIMCEGDPPGVDPEHGRYAYLHEEAIIFLDPSNPSILSTLHEIGHHQLGRSELEACRFAVWLFRAVFPTSYEKLRWEGHLLVRK